ncbi:MAG: nuclear transport factor 2 family protein [Gemmatimonadaceae bacterium]
MFHLLVALGTVACRGDAEADDASPQAAADRGAPAIDVKAEEQAIRALSQQWLAADRIRDANAVMQNFADDAVTVYGGTLSAGRDAIRKYREGEYAKVAKERPDFRPSWETVAVGVAQAGDMAYESGTYDDAWNGGKNHERGHYLTVWRKVGGQWKVARDMAAPEAAPAAARKAAP